MIFIIQKNPKIDNKYLDSIIDNLLFMENDFIQDIKKIIFEK